MASPVDVCNQAIGELGGGDRTTPRISSFTDGTSLSTECALHYDSARDMALEMHPWNFAYAQAVLQRHTDTPVMKWQYMYHLPTSPWCIKVRGTDQDPGDCWEVGINANEERMLYSNRSSVSIEYTARVENLNIWSPLAMQVLVKVMASKLAKFLTGQNSLTELKLKEAQMLIPEAKGSDAREGTPYKLAPNTTMTYARHAGGGTPWVEGLFWRPF